jgi:hypothetical protein
MASHAQSTCGTYVSNIDWLFNPAGKGLVSPEINKYIITNNNDRYFMSSRGAILFFDIKKE